MKDEARIECELKGKQRGGHIENFILREYETDHGTLVICFGDITGDFRFADGEVIRTSVVEETHIADGYLETRNTFYELGEPGNDTHHPRYASNHHIFIRGETIKEVVK